MVLHEFSLNEIFVWQTQIEIDPLKIRFYEKSSEKKYPFYGQATLNNGIISYLSLDEKYLNNIDGKPTILVHSNNGNVVFLDTPFFLKDGHGATSVLQCDELDENVALYLITCIKKALEKVITWSEKATKTVLKQTKIILPANQTEDNKFTPDFSHMRDYVLKMKRESSAKQSIEALNIGLMNPITSDEERFLKTIP